MRKPFLITTPFPTLDETARILGISRSRRKYLEALVDSVQGIGQAGPSQSLGRTPARKRKAVSRRRAASARKG
jgi:hypothetical protein